MEFVTLFTGVTTTFDEVFLLDDEQYGTYVRFCCLETTVTSDCLEPFRQF